MSSWTVERVRIGGLSSDRDPNDRELIEAPNNLRYEMLLDHVRKVVTDKPLTDEQRTRITEILHTAGGLGDD